MCNGYNKFNGTDQIYLKERYWVGFQLGLLISHWVTKNWTKFIVRRDLDKNVETELLIFALAFINVNAFYLQIFVSPKQFKIFR